MVLPFIKIIEPGSYDWGVASSQIVKRSSRGLIGDDARALVKRSSESIISAARQIDLHPGETLAHLIAIGTTEHYGPNRNGDGFTKECCHVVLAFDVGLVCKVQVPAVGLRLARKGVLQVLLGL